MRRLALLSLLCLGCNFDGSTGAAVPNDGGGGPQFDADPTLPDAGPPPDAVTSCEPNELVCSGDRLETCNADGTGVVSSATVICDFACIEDSRCLGTSNLSGIDTKICDPPGASRALTPQAGSEILVVDSGSGPRITCNPDCGDGSTQVIPAAKIISNTVPNIAMFCLSVLDLPASTGLKTEGNISEAIALIVQSSATINGDIDISGRSYTVTTSLDTSAPAGPGGGRGAGIGMGTGEGSCPGTSGATVGGPQNNVGAGGGGGAMGGKGGNGGNGKSDGDATAAGGTGGTGGISCGVTQQLVPLRGGSGGGSGGDGKNFLPGGGPGGGGGGALQISARDSIVLMGNIVANGGNGYSSGFTVGDNGGGGGGGSGGAILLEAPTLNITGTLSVAGGDGGDGSAGYGGNGAKDGNIDGSNGADQTDDDQSGGGGGGGSGQVRLNATTAPTCTNVSPSGSCSGGVMPSN